MSIHIETFRFTVIKANLLTLIFFTALLSYCGGYNVWLNSSSLPESIALRLALGDHGDHQSRFTYEVDNKTSDRSGIQLVSLNADTGDVTLRMDILKIDKNCSRTNQSFCNVTVYIIVSRVHASSLLKTVANLTYIPITISLPMCECQHVLLPFKGTDRVAFNNGQEGNWFVNITLRQPESLCFPVDSLLFTMTDYTTRVIREDCRSHFSFLKQYQHYHVDADLGEVRVIKKLCVLKNFSHSLSLELKLDCPHPPEGILSRMLTFQLTVQSACNTTCNKTTIGNHRRMRRAPPVNHPPSFSKSDYYERVSEEEPAGVHVVTITATDSDLGEAGILTYSLLSTKDRRSESMFTIDAVTGRLITAQQLDREVMSVHHFKVIARDRGRPIMTAEAKITVYVHDINDHTPKLVSSIYNK